MAKKRRLENIHALLFVVINTLIYGLGFTLSEFVGSPVGGLNDIAVLCFQWSAITVATFGLIYLLSLNRYIFAITFPLLTTLCTVLTYFRYTANVTLTPMLIDLALINDARTNMQVISPQLVAIIILTLILSVAIVCYRCRRISFPNVWLHALLAIGIVYTTNYKIQALSRPLSERMPHSLFYNLRRYMDERAVATAARDTFTVTSIANSDSLTVVFIVGESLRSDHLQINGYHRSTTPNLASEKNVVSLPNIHTVPCFTHVSVPHIFTRADSLTPQRAFNEQSFVTIFKQAGFRTSWLANQESVETYVYFMNECDTLIYANSGKSMYVFDEWLDEALLPDYSNELRNADSKQLIILHTIGSHWWYNSHYTKEFEHYTPTITSRVISSNSKESMINSYDNTILYTDYFIKSVIESLRDRKAILFYLSDHGECLGEDGYFTHGIDRPQLHNPAAFVWYSDSYAAEYADNINTLKNNRLKRYHSDYLFHSIIDAADISSPYMQAEHSIFK